ncbi:glycosyltransferase family 4 protein [Sphingomonas sp. Leaf10]|uniref:glycosyltransferase family 4 protein n=1 Tax=Sphingomonas sp. Leaf10 TaxID=1735676 RepID=UPI0006F4197E|nr:glycosyltransferase family 4 protein [Sphingomonas sp. Leaf10]KQM36577.1 glycosyl transferase family 1 [Sphingomonas sp. Leaf10]
MDILFIHQNMPAQFKHLAPALAASGKHRVVFVTRGKGVDIPGVRCVGYEAPRPANPTTHHYVRLYEASVRYGQQVARTLLQLKREGFVPTIVIGHPGWGEMMFVRDVFPRAVILSYAEFYYHGAGADVGFDPAQPADLDTVCRTRARNAHLLLSLDMADAGIAPTEWQRSRHPEIYQPRIRTIFDGVETDVVKPDPAARFRLPDGRTLSRQDEVITYVARNLEPYRGYPSFIRALPAILAARPEAQVVITGGDQVSYGAPAPDGRSWREQMELEISLTTGPFADRVHFTGKLSYANYLSLLRVSSVHTYLTVPFVLSWSFIEAMATGCVMVASDTAPVLEFLEPGINGHLVPFHDPAAIADRIIGVLADRSDHLRLRKAARATAVGRCALSVCLPRQMQLVEQLTGVSV